MNTHTSILSGGKTRELFAQLDKKNPTRVADARSNYAGVTLRLRYAYARDTYGYDQKGFASKVRYILTGGMVLSWSMEDISRTYSNISAGQVRIKPDTDEKQQKAVSRAITRILRMAKDEQMRVWHVKQLETLDTPFQNDDEFIKFVEKWEKIDGKTSDYTSLSIEDCEKWTDRIKHYKSGLNAIDFYAEPQHQVEGTLANFDRYIAGDR